ncbi:MAG: glycosyl hydrolase family 18 protein [Bacteroidales bacterium]|nr:glycosyl hydrolase family 18 protein [Bacteroidales bacterium]
MRKTIILLSVVFLSQICLAQENGYKSIRQIEHEKYSKYNFTRQEQWDSLYRVEHPDAVLPKVIPSKKSRACNLNKRVFGWHPGWLSANEYLNYDYSLISDLCYFGYEVNPSTGYATTTYNWLTAPVVTDALNAGVNVSLCVILFASHATFLNSSTAKQNLISNVISLVQQRGANGVNIDFEGMDPSTSTSFANFMIDLCQQMHSAIPGSEVSIAMPAGNWSGTYSSSTVPYIDLYLIMGYDYYWSSAPNAGPVAPKYSNGFWDMGDETGSIVYYLNAGIPKNKLALGIPYYGYDWPTTSTALKAATTGGAFSRKYPNAAAAAQTYTRKWDNNSATPYFTYNSGGSRQCWYDDEISLGLKYDMVNMFDIAGIGIWALGYDDGSTALWDLLKDKFTSCATPVSCTGTITDMGGPGNYYNYENWTYTIAPPSAGSITLTFTSFSTESNYDFLYIYNGDNTSSPLIGKYSGTTSPGTVVANSGKITLKFTSDNATTSGGWVANWACSVDNTAPTTSISVPSTWETKNFTATFTDADNTGGSGLAKSMYHVVDNNGTEWRANPTRGFYRDNFTTSIHSDWTETTGTWGISSGALVQTDETLANTNISAPLTQNLSSRYVYNWSGKIEGTGTNRRAGIYIMCDDATATDRGNAYMIWFRADLSQVDIYKSVNSVLGSPLKSAAVTITPGTAYDYKIIFDRSTGDMKVYVNNVLVSSWKDSSPYTDGSYISFRTGNCKYTVDNLYVYRSRNSTATITVGAASTNAARYQNASPGSPACMIKSIVMDSAGNLSSVASKSVNIDWTPPANVAEVRDGTGNDINFTTSTTQLSANWDESADVNSGVVKYWYAIGTTAGAKDVVNWTDNDTDKTLTKTGLSLTIGQMYYVMVKAENGAGLLSDSVISDGQMVQNPTAINELTDVFNLSVFPNPFSKNITIKYELNKTQEVEIKLADVLGKEIIIENKINQVAGKYSITIDAEALGLAKGIYVLKIRTENNENIIKIIHY